MKTRIITSMTTVMLLLLASATHAQVTYDDGLDHVYQSVVAIYPSDPSWQGDGYAISTTAVDVVNGTTRGQVVRTDPNGNQLWAFGYNTNSGDNHRFTHIEKITQVTGNVQFLLVGSVDYGGSGSLTVTVIDDNGAVFIDEEFFPNSRNYLTGIKGIFDNFLEFIIVGVESDGFAPTDEKDILVLSLDASMSVLWEYELSTPHNVYDYDMVTDVFSTTAGEFAIVGTSNDNSLAQSQPAAMVAALNPGGVFWDYNFSTGAPGFAHIDNAACGIYDPNNQSIWVLGNSSSARHFNLTEFDAGTGTLLNLHDFANDDEHPKVGFELRESLVNTDHLIIAGYQYADSLYSTNDDAMPFLVEFDKPASAINWSNVYKTSSAGILSFNENNMLYMTALGPFPYYYNNMMDYKYDNTDGYAFLSTDDQLSGMYGFKLSGADIFGDMQDPNCGQFKTHIYHYTGSRFQTDPLSPVSSPVNPNGPFVYDDPHGYNDSQCGSILKKGRKDSDAVADDNGRVYPNPASDVLHIEGYPLATQVSIHDLSGKLVYAKEVAKASDISFMSIDHLNSGMYLVKIMNHETLLDSKKLQVVE